MKKVILLFVLFILGAIAVIATPAEICEYIQTKADGKSIPKSIPYKNEIINVYTLDGDTVGSLTISDRVIGDTKCSTLEEPSFNVYIKDLQTAENINDAGDRVAKFKEKMSDGDIKLEGARFFKKIKLWFTKIALKFM